MLGESFQHGMGQDLEPSAKESHQAVFTLLKNFPLLEFLFSHQLASRLLFKVILLKELSTYMVSF